MLGPVIVMVAGSFLLPFALIYATISTKGGNHMGGDLKYRKQIGVTMDINLYNRLKAYADKMMIPMSRIIDKSVTEYLDKVEKK